MPEPSEADITADVKRVGSSLGLSPGQEFGLREYHDNGGQFTSYQIYDGGRCWSHYRTSAGFTTKERVAVADEVYFQNLVAATKQLGRYPKASERRHFRLNFSKRRYPTLTALIEQAIALGIVEDLRRKLPEVQAVTPPVPQEQSSPTAAIPAHVPRAIPPIPAQTKRSKWARIGIQGFPCAPQDELSVVALFGILCANGTLDWDILEMNGGKGIDATCFDHKTGKEIRVELKRIHSRGSWNHTADEIDYVVCWENRWPDFPKPVIELRQVLSSRDGAGANTACTKLRRRNRNGEETGRESNVEAKPSPTRRA